MAIQSPPAAPPGLPRSRWSLAMTASSIRRTGLIGWPVAHSLSPAIHAYWLKQYQLAGSYELFPCEPAQLESAVARLREEAVGGFNVTVPHKQAIIPFIDAVDAVARKIGAVNTVVAIEGHLLGTNSDAYGFITNLWESVADLKPYLPSVVLLGAGGAARAALAALKEAGAKEITILNRTQDTAKKLAEEFGVSFAHWENPAALLAKATLLVNTTLLGMEGKPPLELSLEALPRQALVHDIVYAPLETELLRAARARGNPTVDGLGMLLHQAAAAFRLWHGVDPAVTPELRAYILKRPA